MNDTNDKLQKVLETLRRERDELRVKLELGKLEIRDQWEPLETQWEALELKLRNVGDTTTESGKEVLGASKALLSEIGDAYKQIWKQIKD